MATTTRTRTTKPADETGADEQAPAVPEFSTQEPAEKPPEKRRPLFSIDGSEFTVPATIGPRIVYLGLNQIRTNGALFSTMYLTELLLGTNQYAQLLRHYEEGALSEDQFDKITGMVSDVFYDHFKDDEEGKGDSDSSADTSPTS